MTQSISHTQQSPKPLESRHSIDSCIFQLRTWKPFTNKRPCLSDRKTPSVSIDLSKLSLLDDDSTNKPFKSSSAAATNFRLIARKRRRRGSRSVSGRSSDRSGTRRCCSVGASAAHGTCSDFPVAMGTDSSGELFGNVGDANWSSDVSEARRERDREGVLMGMGMSLGMVVNLGIVVMLSLVMVMSLMRKKMIPGSDCCSGVNKFEL